jgi:hypothetical protein
METPGRTISRMLDSLELSLVLVTGSVPGFTLYEKHQDVWLIKVQQSQLTLAVRGIFLVGLDHRQGLW